MSFLTVVKEKTGSRSMKQLHSLSKNVKGINVAIYTKSKGYHFFSLLSMKTASSK
jgi:hypothetical protein